MGVPKLTSFMRQCFTSWKEEEIKGHLVIDGCSLCYQLYDDLDWMHGGQYPEYRERIIEYFKALQSSEIIPIVVFDGIDYTGEKSDTIAERCLSSVKEIFDRFYPTGPDTHVVRQPESETASQLFSEASGPFTSQKVVLPLFAWKLFSEVLSELSIRYIVVDGEADRDLVKLANFYSCPVLSNDSDFYIFNLKGGFVHMDNFEWNARPITSRVYYVREFVNEFKLADESLRFIIPAIFGNDFITAIESSYKEFFRHMQRVTSLFRTRCHPTLPVVIYASHYDNLQDFIDRIPSIEYLNTKWKKMLRANCIKSKHLYDIQEECSFEDLYRETELQIDEEYDIPKWLLSQFRQLNFSPSVMMMAVCGGYTFPAVSENPMLPTSFCISRDLRWVVYGVLGLDDVVEGTRIGVSSIDVELHSIEVISNGQNITLDTVPTVNLYNRKKLIYSCLHCNLDLIELLEIKWRLVIASVVFWRRRGNIPLMITKVLLLTFVLCSGGNVAKLLDGITVDQKFLYGPKWLKGLHSFAQWQCTYKDASSLNIVLETPLEFCSLAHLYNGMLALGLYYLSMESDISPVFSQLPKESKELYGQLLCTILSHKTVNHSSEEENCNVKVPAVLEFDPSETWSLLTFTERKSMSLPTTHASGASKI